MVKNNLPVWHINSDSQLVIDNGIFLTSLEINGFKFTPRGNGNLSFG